MIRECGTRANHINANVNTTTKFSFSIRKIRDNRKQPPLSNTEEQKVRVEGSEVAFHI